MAGRREMRYRLVGGLLLAGVVGFVAGSVGTPSRAAVTQVGELMERLASPLAEERSAARAGLLVLGEAAVPSLIFATEAEDSILRWEAVNLLGMLGDLRATDAVLRVATADRDVHARWRANWAITNLDDGTVVPRLIAALSGEDPAVSWNAAVTLSLFGAVEAVPILHQGLTTEGWRQWEAVNALGRVWNDETAARLTALLRDAAEDVRKEAALSLGRIGGELARVALLDALWGDASPEVRWRAAMMIGHIGDETVIPLLENRLSVEDHPLVIAHIEEALEALRSSR